MNANATRKTAVFGASGQVGRAWLELLGASAIALDRTTADLSTPEQLAPLLDRIHASTPLAAVVNAAAYTAVDQAEKEETLAHTINATSPGVIARWCAAHDVPLVHYSTDYVFSGAGTKPWSEEDEVAPLSAYGRTKLAGEREVTAAGGKTLIFRTSWVYDAYGKNFVRTMLHLGAERDTLRVVADQFGAPTYAPHLAHASFVALQKAVQGPVFPSGIYHLCNAGETSWHGFASRIFDRARALGISLAVKAVEAIPTSAYPTPATRPLNSRLNLDKAARVFALQLPNWVEGLEECLLTLKKGTSNS